MLKQLFISFIFFISIFITTELVHSHSICSREKHKVVIIGAGIAGIGAATHLLRNNISDILILEASDRVGGRLFTTPFADFLVEVGCQWVHGQKGNPVYEIAEPHGVLYVQSSDLVPTLMKHSKSKVDMCVARPLFKEALDLFENDEDMAACSCSMGDYFDRKYEKMVKEKNVDQYTGEAVRDLIMKVQGIEDGTGDLTKEGSAGNTNYWIPQGSVSVAWKSGYQTFIDMLMDKYTGEELPVLDKIIHNSVVDHIDWSGNTIKISCKNGSHYFADHVIITVSLGVLKNFAKEMFTPALPRTKLTAIQTLGFDVVNKVFIQFHSRWWPLVHDFHKNFLWSNEDKNKFKQQSAHGGWGTEITSFHYVENNPRVLEGWVVGETAYKLEHMSEKEVLDGCMEVLYWFFGNTYKISQPIDIIRSKWASNEFVRGAYSFPTKESDHLKLSPSDLAEPLLHNYKYPAVLFAGEATHDHYFSTVHGALESGWREANRILDFIKSV